MKGCDREEFREVGQAGVAKRKGLPELFPLTIVSRGSCDAFDSLFRWCTNTSNNKI
jgi:hypothetical protein